MYFPHAFSHVFSIFLVHFLMYAYFPHAFSHVFSSCIFLMYFPHVFSGSSRNHWMMHMYIQSGAAGCVKGFVTCFLRVPQGWTAAAILPKQARGTSRKYVAKPCTQPTAPDCIAPINRIRKRLLAPAPVPALCETKTNQETKLILTRPDTVSNRTRPPVSPGKCSIEREGGRKRKDRKEL